MTNKKCSSGTNHCKNNHLLVPNVFFPARPEIDDDMDWRMELFQTVEHFRPNDRVIGRGARLMIPPAFFQELHSVNRERAISTVVTLDEDNDETLDSEDALRSMGLGGAVLIALLFFVTAILIVVFTLI